MTEDGSAAANGYRVWALSPMTTRCMWVHVTGAYVVANFPSSFGRGGADGVRGTTSGAGGVAVGGQRRSCTGDQSTGGDGGGAGAECRGGAVRLGGVRAVQPSDGAAVH